MSLSSFSLSLLSLSCFLTLSVCTSSKAEPNTDLTLDPSPLDLASLGSDLASDLRPAKALKLTRRSAGCTLHDEAKTIGDGDERALYAGGQLVVRCECQSGLDSPVVWLHNNAVVDENSDNVFISRQPTESRITMSNVSKQQEGSLCCNRSLSSVCIFFRVVSPPAVTISAPRCRAEETANDTELVETVICGVSSYLELGTGYMQLLLNNETTIVYDPNPTDSIETDPRGKKVWRKTYNLSQEIPKNIQSILVCEWDQVDGNVYHSESSSYGICPVSTQSMTAATWTSTNATDRLSNTSSTPTKTVPDEDDSSQSMTPETSTNAADRLSNTSSTSTKTTPDEGDSSLETWVIILVICLLIVIIIILGLLQFKFRPIACIRCNAQPRRSKEVNTPDPSNYVEGLQSTNKTSRHRQSFSDESWRKKLLDDDWIQCIGPKLGNYEMLARKLGFIQADLENLRRDYLWSNLEQGIGMLHQWKTRMKDKATLGELDTAAREADRHDLLCLWTQDATI